ncbi:MAG: hypothetical protein M5U15_07755 [Kiritimatiellae bacterium]|nr:hypothetical protein [Kiritimatiellia bacterium]
MRCSILAACVAATLVGSVSIARAQMTTPLHIGNTNAILNEFGDILPGNNAEPGALVMVLWASNNTIYAPGPGGEPHMLNPPISNGTTAIGPLRRAVAFELRPVQHQPGRTSPRRRQTFCPRI